MQLDRVPDTIDDPLWSGDLVPRIERGAAFAQDQAASDDVAGEDPPQITIGRPQLAGDLRTIAGKKADDATKALLQSGDFYVIRFACSFRRRSPDVARFTVQLNGADGGLVAYDLFPLRIDQKVSRDVKVSFAPNLKFSSAEVGTGNFELGFQYDELRPTIVAEGALESNVAWVFASAPGYAPAGTQVMHMIVKAPRGTQKATADLHFTATIGRHLWALPLPGAEHSVAVLRDVPLWG